jgi:hypothetical protein
MYSSGKFYVIMEMLKYHLRNQWPDLTQSENMIINVWYITRLIYNTVNSQQQFLKSFKLKFDFNFRLQKDLEDI